MLIPNAACSSTTGHDSFLRIIISFQRRRRALQTYRLLWAGETFFQQTVDAGSRPPPRAAERCPRSGAAASSVVMPRCRMSRWHATLPSWTCRQRCFDPRAHTSRGQIRVIRGHEKALGDNGERGTNAEAEQSNCQQQFGGFWRAMTGDGKRCSSALPTTRARVAVSATFAMVGGGGGGKMTPTLTRKLGKLEGRTIRRSTALGEPVRSHFGHFFRSGEYWGQQRSSKVKFSKNDGFTRNAGNYLGNYNSCSK